jgi:DNA-PKcs, CC5
MCVCCTAAATTSVSCWSAFAARLRCTPVCTDHWLTGIYTLALHRLHYAMTVPHTATQTLQLSKSTPDYKAKLFERGLEDCVLEPMHIDTDATSSGSSLSAALSVAPMTPLFSLASQAASQLSDSSSSSSRALASWGTLALDVSKRERGMLRATQDYKWTQTLAAGSSDSSQAAESRMVFGTQAADTTAAVTAARAMAPPPPRRPRVGGRQTAVAAGGEGSQAAGAVVAVAGPLGSQQQAVRRRRQRGAQQQRKVVLYRTYRKGELPDIEIQLQDILRPLQHLALRDRQTARLLFEKLFGGIFSSSSSSSNSNNSVQKQLATALQSVLASAKHDTELVACLHTAYAEAVDATAAAAGDSGAAAAAAAAAAVPTLPPALVAESALRSLNCHSGALLLEQGLTRNAAVVAAAAAAATAATGGAAGGTTPRRASGSGRRTAAAAAQARADKAAAGSSAAAQDGSSSSSSDDQNAWLQLSRLYFELGDADMLVGLIARTVRVARTREALEAELSGDINRAVRLYNELENEHYEGVAGSEASVAELVSSTALCVMHAQVYKYSKLVYTTCV